MREGWIWNVKIIRNLQDWEIDEFCNLLQCLDSRKLNDTRDMRVWKPDEKKGFLVRFMYTILCKRDNCRFSNGAPFKQIWKSRALPRVAFLTWKAVKETILTINMLKRRWITMVNKCYLCKSDEKTSNHLLLRCPKTHSLWTSVLGLLGLNCIMAENVSRELLAWAGFCKKTMHLSLIPLTIFWVVWKERNAKAFENIETNFTYVKDRWIYIFGYILFGRDINDWEDLG